MNAEKDVDFFERMRPAVVDGFISCKQLLAAARAAGISGEEARSCADDHAIKIHQCQLGFFGWKKEANPSSGEIPRDLAACIHSKAKNNAVTCPDLWGCAASCGVSRRETGTAADRLGYKARGCQLGIF